MVIVYHLTNIFNLLLFFFSEIERHGTIILSKLRFSFNCLSYGVVYLKLRKKKGDSGMLIEKFIGKILFLK